MFNNKPDIPQDNAELITTLSNIIGKKYVFSTSRQTLPFRRAFRGHDGPALCAVQPGTLLELWLVLKQCVASDVVIVMQAANTSLTGGATPIEITGRCSVVINTQRLKSIQLLETKDQG